MSKELKELLKPPFKPDGDLQVLSNDSLSVSFNSGSLNTSELCIEVRQWLTEAINEKYARDFGGVKGWIYVVLSETDHGIICPDCRLEYSFSRKPIWSDYQYCPHCGQRLLPSKEEK